MPSTNWTGTAGDNNFNTAGNWTAGVPIAGEDATIDGTATAPLTILFKTGTDTANTLGMAYATLSMSGGSLTLQNASGLDAFIQSAGTLDFQNGGSNSAVSSFGGPVTETGGTIKVDAGALDLYGGGSFAGKLTGAGAIVFRGAQTYTLNSGTSLTLGALDVIDNGTTLALATSLTYTGALYQAGNTAITLGANTLTLSGTDTLGGLVTGAAGGRLVSSGSLTTDAMTLGGALVLENKGTLSFGSIYNLYIGDSSSSTASLLNDAGATIDITGDFTMFRNGNTTLVNAGTLEKTGSNGTSYIDPALTDTGTILADSGTLYFRNNDSFAGAINGTATVAFGGSGTDTLLTGTVLNVAHVDVVDNGTDLVLTLPLIYSGSLYQAVNTAITLGANTLTLSGTDTLGGLVTGAAGGRLVSSGSLTADYMTLGGALVLENKGTLSFGSNNNLVIGDSSSSTASLLNDAGATIDITGDWSIYRNGNTTLVNAGTLEKTGNTGTSYIDPALTDTGTILADSGTLYFRNNDSFAGAINGTATVAFGGGCTDTLAHGTKLTVANLDVLDNGTTLLITTKLSYAGALYQAGNTTITLKGVTLTLTGSAGLHGLVGGTGTLLLNKTLATLSTDGMTLGGSVTLENKGVAGQAANITLGDTSAASATLKNDLGAHYNITADVSIYHNGTGEISNAGSFAKTGGTGTSSVGANMVNTGTVAVDTGRLEFTGLFTNDATVSATTGGTVEFNNSLTADASKTGTVTITLGATATFDQFVASSQSVTFGDNSGHAVLNDAGNFDATFAGFQLGNTIDVTGLGLLSAPSFTGGVLSLQNSSHVTVAQLHFSGSYTLANFVLASDGNGGTLITDPPAGAAADLTGWSAAQAHAAAAANATAGGGGGHPGSLFDPIFAHAAGHG